jgi:hypothetical protein
MPLTPTLQRLGMLLCCTHYLILPPKKNTLHFRRAILHSDNLSLCSLRTPSVVIPNRSAYILTHPTKERATCMLAYLSGHSYLLR